MVTVPDDLDEAFAGFEALAKAYDKALAQVDAELAAGRIGHAALQHASTVFTILTEYVLVLGPRIEEVRRSL